MLASCLRKQQVLSRHNYVLSPAKSFSEIIYQRGGILEQLCPSPRELSPTPRMGHWQRWKWARLRMLRIMSENSSSHQVDEKEAIQGWVSSLTTCPEVQVNLFFKKNSSDISFSLSIVGLSPFYSPQIVSGNFSISLLSPGSTQNCQELVAALIAWSSVQFPDLNSQSNGFSCMSVSSV